jgi:hypothetical protein
VPEPVIYGEEVVGLLFTLNEVSTALRELRDVLVEKTMAKKRTTKADLARWDENNRRLLKLAQKAQAELDRRKQPKAGC